MKTLSFEYDYPHAGRLPVTAKLEGDKLVGTIGDNADFEATRVEETDPISGMWKGLIMSMDADISIVLSLDADEELSPELAREIQQVLDDADDEIAGYELPRKTEDE